MHEEWSSLSYGCGRCHDAFGTWLTCCVYILNSLPLDIFCRDAYPLPLHGFMSLYFILAYCLCLCTVTLATPSLLDLDLVYLSLPFLLINNNIIIIIIYSALYLPCRTLAQCLHIDSATHVGTRHYTCQHDANSQLALGSATSHAAATPSTPSTPSTSPRVWMQLRYTPPHHAPASCTPPQPTA